MKDFMTSNYGDSKLSKKVELNSEMTITSSGIDELTSHLRSSLN